MQNDHDAPPQSTEAERQSQRKHRANKPITLSVRQIVLTRATRRTVDPMCRIRRHKGLFTDPMSATFNASEVLRATICHLRRATAHCTTSSVGYNPGEFVLTPLPFLPFAPCSCRSFASLCRVLNVPTGRVTSFETSQLVFQNCDTAKKPRENSPWTPVRWRLVEKTSKSANTRHGQATCVFLHIIFTLHAGKELYQKRITQPQLYKRTTDLW